METTWGFEQREFNLGNWLDRYYWRKKGKKGALWEHSDGNCRKWVPGGPLLSGRSQEPPTFLSLWHPLVGPDGEPSAFRSLWHPLVGPDGEPAAIPAL